MKCWYKPLKKNRHYWFLFQISIRHQIALKTQCRQGNVACHSVLLLIVKLVHDRRWEKRDWKVVEWWVKRSPKDVYGARWLPDICFGFLICPPKNHSHQMSFVGIPMPVKNCKVSINIGRLLEPKLVCCLEMFLVSERPKRCEKKLLSIIYRH